MVIGEERVKDSEYVRFTRRIVSSTKENGRERGEERERERKAVPFSPLYRCDTLESIDAQIDPNFICHSPSLKHQGFQISCD